jgi:predicted lipoprotein with Yx(FWY)xxD motif
MQLKHTLAALAATAIFAACALIGSAPTKVADGVVTGPNGMTLYTFDKDPAGTGKSVCNDKCAGLWPPFYAPDGASSSGDYTIITRDDGRKQWALKGKPLYYWMKDQKPGDRSGDGVNKVWWAAKP